MIGSQIVSIIKTECYQYPDRHSFRPGEKYPEYFFDEISECGNKVYDSVRSAIAMLGFDAEHFGTEKWNPLGDVICPGMNVLIKPNLVIDQNNSNNGEDCLYTHPSVVAPVIDYVILALKGTGKIVIGDAPVQECDFEKLIHISGYKNLIDYYKSKGIDICIVDFRGVKSVLKKGVLHLEINENSRGTIVNLGKHSEFAGLDKSVLNRLRITNYNPELLKQHHNKYKHEYNISNYVLRADVIINMPKPKTHRIAGVTISLKNLVGANTRKEYLPHHTLGLKNEGGDESNAGGAILKIRAKLLDYKNIKEYLGEYNRARVAIFGVRVCSLFLKSISTYREGCWYGNNTINKTILDLNKIIYYANKNGELCKTPQRKIIIIADMLVAGEKEGPMTPSLKCVGIIAAGTNPVCFDETICTLMGFDINKVPTIKNARQLNHDFPIVASNQQAFIKSNDERYGRKIIAQIADDDLFWFAPTSGWKGHIEKQKH